MSYEESSMFTMGIKSSTLFNEKFAQLIYLGFMGKDSRLNSLVKNVHG